MIKDFDYNDLYNAYLKAKNSRKNKQEVYLFDQNREERLKNMFLELKSRKYKHSLYKKIIIFDSKKRLIYSPSFRDHIIHHLLYAKIYNLIDSSFLDCSFACRKWYGSHKAINYLRDLILKNTDSNEKLYYLKLDFSKYFFSINHKILKDKLSEVIKNEELLYIISIIIDSYKSSQIYDDLLGDWDFYLNEENKWIPIWSIISQLFANFFLDDFDKFIRFWLKLDFVRYMDDILILWNKKSLSEAKDVLFKLAWKNKLILNPKKVSFNIVWDWINFVWYKIWNNKIYVWKSTKNKTNKFLDVLNWLDINKFDENDLKKINSSLQSRFWVFSHSSFWVNYFKNRGNIDFIRGANANNGSNAGVFTMNLNRTSTNQNRNVGFRLVE